MKKATEQIERRKYRRYIVRGRIRFMIDSLEVWAELVNFGEGGLLIRCPFDLPVGTCVALRVRAFGYSLAVDGIGRVVGGRGDLLAIQFIEKSPEAAHFLRWLEVEHYPWTGTFDAPDVEPRQDAAPRQPAQMAWAQKRFESASMLPSKELRRRFSNERSRSLTNHQLISD